MSIPFKQCNERNYRKGRAFAISWICLHFTSGNGDTAQNNADYFAREGGLNASAHYFVDTERIVQSVKDGDTSTTETVYTQGARRQLLQRLPERKQHRH